MSTIEYNGLIVTTVELKTEKDGVPITSSKDNDGKTVYFTGNSTNGSRAFFLNNIKGTQTGSIFNRTWEFTATIVSPAKASEIVADGFGNGKETIPLFCIHGYASLIEKNLGRVEKAKDKFEEAGTYYPVPVIWPSGIFYTSDKRSSEEAGKIFRCFVECIPNGQFPRKSLMMHSMGNFLVHCRNGGIPLDVQFDNIFMVAADIAADIFSDDPCNEDDKKKAENWKELLGKNGGKIFVVHSTKDNILRASALTHIGIQRLGLHGTTGDTRDELKDTIVNVNATENVYEVHPYHFEKWIIQQYNELPTKK